MKYWYPLAAFVIGMFIFALGGCSASWFSCTTEASYHPENGWSYKSCKNQENFHAKIGEAEVSTTSTTPEAAIAAATGALAKVMDAFSRLIPLIEKLALMATPAAPAAALIPAPKPPTP